jgi:hypothetical protein
MIHPAAVKEFIREPRDSHVWVKKLKRSQLWDVLDDSDFRPLTEDLDLHQLACLALGLAYPRFSFWLDMGLGKTLIVLCLLQHFWRIGTLRRGLILAVSEDAVYNWELEMRKWKFRVPYVALGNSPTVEKWQHIAEMGAGLVICTYPGFNHLFAKRVKRKKKAGNQMKPDLGKIRRFAANLDAFIPDESIHLGNYQSLGFKIAKPLTADCEIVYPLAGRPFGRDPILMWAQQYLVDRGESFGETLGLFRAALFTEEKGYFGGYEYKFRKDMEPDFTRMVKHRSISYRSDECVDLPPVSKIPVKVKLPPETLAYFDRFMEQMRAARGDKQKIENIFLRMRQLSSGFIGYKDDDTGERAQIVMPTNPKLDDLLDNIQDMPYDRKFVIVHEFTWSGRTIMEGLAKRKIKAGWLWSGAKDRKLIRRRFDEDDPSKFKGIVGNWRVMAESLNLQTANYLHFFETPVGVIMREQAEARTFRPGQTRKGFMYDYLATLADVRVRAFHKEGANIFAALIRDPFRALKG